MGKWKTLAIVFCLLALFIAKAQAGPIMFTRHGSGSGTLDGQSFSADFTLTSIGDTSNRQSHSASTWFIAHISTSISIDGVGDFEFLTPTLTFCKQNWDLVAFATGSGAIGLDLYYGPTRQAFATWDMLGPIGPYGGTGEFLQWTYTSVQTTGGRLIFNDQQSYITFEAEIIPEPATLLLLGFGAMMLRKKRVRR